jgi:hypothetical protein
MNQPSLEQQITYGILRRIIDCLLSEGVKPPFSEEQVHEATRRIFRDDPQLQSILQAFKKHHA